MILPALALAAMPSPAPSGFDRDRLNLIPAQMREAVARGTVAGTVVLVRERGKTVLVDAQGLARLEPPAPMRRDTIFQVMSMTKPIVAMAATILAERGRLRLDDRVDRWLPAFRRLTVRRADGTLAPATKAPTIRQLMNHTAGFGGNDPAGIDDDTKRKMELGPYVDRLPEAPLDTEPGERVSYSGLGFSTLGRIVELASGQPLTRFMEAEIFAPLGMRDTSFFLPEAKRPRAAWLAVPGESGRLVQSEDPYREGARLANPAGGLYSTADDMGRLLDVLIFDGRPVGSRRILSPAGARAMRTLTTDGLLPGGTDSQGYGLGFSVVRNAGGQSSLKPVGAFGHTGAFGTEFWGDAERGVAAVFLAQGFEGTTEARKSFNTMVNAAYVGR